jgi:hypothetical protein
MTTTSTYTRTTAFPRLEIIKAQVRKALRRTTNISLAALSKTVEAGIDNHWLYKFTIYGLDSRKLCRAQLILEIDWDEYDFQLSRGRAVVVIDERWEDNTSIEVDEAILLFNKFVNSYSLTTKWRVTHTPGLNTNEIFRNLGLGRVKPLNWGNSNPTEWRQTIPEIPDLCVGLYLID